MNTMKPYRPVILIVLDGFGISEETRGNPVYEAEKPTLDFLEKNFPFTTIQASSLAVGLPFGEAGNSEVGHLTIGAGRPIFHHLPRIIHSIHDGSFYQNPAFLKAIDHVRKNSSKLHLLGLVSSGSVHAYIEHLWALLELLKRNGFSGNVYLHVIMDGKDAPPRDGKNFIEKTAKKISAEFPFVSVASIIGRMYCMDRDELWDRIRTSYEALTAGNGNPFRDPVEYIGQNYKKGIFDEFIEPGVLVDGEGKSIGRVEDNDAMITFNFREDSMREISRALAQDSFAAFSRQRLNNFLRGTMTEYEEGLEAESAFPPLSIRWGLSETISHAGENQLHIAESEKYAHVTYFFNGGREDSFPHEERLLIPSPKTAHFDETPEMNAEGVKKAILDNFSSFGFILANFANADMVGHSGNFEAVKKSIQTMDSSLSEIVKRVLESGAVLVITGDHGNAERKLDVFSGERSTKHTTNAVPFFVIGKDFGLGRERTMDEVVLCRKSIGGVLTDVSPTVLELMGIEKPKEMIGKSLLADITGKI